jgi:hypothetical protein
MADDKDKKKYSYRPEIEYQDTYESEYLDQGYKSVDADSSMHDTDSSEVIDSISNTFNDVTKIIQLLPVQLQTAINSVYKPVLDAWSSMGNISYPHTIPDPDKPNYIIPKPVPTPDPIIGKPPGPGLPPDPNIVKPQIPVPTPDPIIVTPPGPGLPPDPGTVTPQTPVPTPDPIIVTPPGPGLPPDPNIDDPQAPDPIIGKPPTPVLPPDPNIDEPETPDPIIGKPPRPVLPPDPNIDDPEAPDPIIGKPPTPGPNIVKPLTPDPIIVDPLTPVLPPDPIIVKPLTPDPIIGKPPTPVLPEDFPEPTGPGGGGGSGEYVIDNDGIWDSDIPIYIKFDSVNPIEIIDKEYIRNISDLFNFYVNKLKDVLYHYYSEKVAAMFSKKMIDGIPVDKTKDEITFLFTPITTNCKDVDKNDKHLFDASLAMGEHTLMKLNFMENAFSVDQTLFQLKNFKTIYLLRRRYAEIESTDASNKTNAMSNNILKGMRTSYEQKYDISFGNLYKYINSSLDILEDVLNTELAGLRAKRTLVEKGGIK